MATQVVILAAGQGKRMHSKLPKMLHRLAGKPLLEHVITTALSIEPKIPPIIVHGHQGDVIRQALKHHDLRWVEQKEQLGTGHALLQALPEIANDDQVLVLYGDVPLTSVSTLKKLIAKTPKEAVGLLTVHLENPFGYGRIKRDSHNQIMGVVEEKDATEEERAIKEANPGIYFIAAKYLKKWLPKLKNKNAQGEYYLTDVIELAAQDNIAIHTVQPDQTEEILGINDRMQLAQLERFYQLQYAKKLMQQGVTLLDPHRLDIRGELQVGRDVTIDVNVIIEGKVVIGDDCSIGANTILRDIEIGNQVEIKENCVIEDAKISARCVIGPFARIRPGTELLSDVHIGNFVEIKNSTIDEKSKINHLSYVGDTEVGKRVNIGAGTITCNYDGANKHKTIIGDDVHIGSDTQLVAPVTIGEGATIGAGSTITKDAPPKQLTITHRIDQRSVEAWKRPEKNEKLS